MASWLKRLFSHLEPDDSHPLPIRLFQLICATAAILCLLVILPVNSFQNLPREVNVADALLGITAGFCYWESGRGRHHILGFFVILILLVDPVWYLNGGSMGSITYYFFPVLLYPLAIFQGRMRWITAIFLVLNVSGLFLLEYFYPALTVPFHQPSDRVIDLVSGVFCSFLAVAAMVGLILANYEREHDRISRYTRALGVSEQNYREIFNATSDAVFIRDEAGRLIDVNDRTCAMFGYERSEVLGLSVNDLSLGTSPYSQVEGLQMIARTFREGPQVFLWRSRRQNGELFWSEVALRAGVIAGQKRVISAVRDISARMRAEAALRTSEERLRLSLAASRQGWFDLNVVTGEGIASGEYARIIGAEPVDFTARVADWLDGIHPEDRAGVEREFRACIAAGGVRTMDYRRRTAAGGWKWIRSTGTIVERDAAGKPVRMAGTHADITEQKELEAQLLHRQRLESIGTLAGGVAHDLNNILTPILVGGSLLRDKLTDEKDRDLMALLESGAKRGAAIVRQLLTFSSDMEGRVPVDPRQLVQETIDFVRATFPREIDVVSRLPAGLWWVTGDPTQLHQVLMNLCLNARDAMPDGGTLILSAENTELTGEQSSRNPWGSGGRLVVLAVTDTGPGIPPEIRSRIFDPFFTTKEVGKGTGLGLSSVHGIVKAHGGTVTVESEPGRGASFRVLLPATLAVIPAEFGPPAAQRPAQPGRLILVLDDEEAVLTTTQRLLESSGFHVIAAGRGVEAIRLIKEHRRELKVVITDMTMPEMDGMTVVPLLREIVPDLRVIGVSGLDFGHRQAELSALGFAEMLQKPYGGAELLAAVNRQFQVADENEAAASVKLAPKL